MGLLFLALAACASPLAMSPAVELPRAHQEPEPAPAKLASQVVPHDALILRSFGRDRERLLEQRFVASKLACAPPDAGKVREREDALLGYLGPSSGKSRSLSASERHDLAYALVAVEGSGPEVGSFPDDELAPPLAEGSSNLLLHGQRRREMGRARLEGNLERYVDLGTTDLMALGYPGPLRVHAEGDIRWGWTYLSEEMLDVALAAELLGERAVAHDLYRRANPGPYLNSSKYNQRRQTQIAGLIRTAPDCRSVVAEILYAVNGHDAYGPLLLARAGFDVERTYRGLLATLHTKEDWSERTRAIRGLADVAKGGAIDRLVRLLKESTAYPRTQVEILEALSDFAGTTGIDPCDPSATSYPYAALFPPREISAANLKCETRLAPSRIASLSRSIAPYLASTDERVRIAAAWALACIAEPGARPLLVRVASRDPSDWVRHSVTDAIARLGGTENTRRDERKRHLPP